MAKYLVFGFDDLLQELNDVNNQIVEICGAAIYEGAAEYADELKRQIRAIPNQSGKPPFRGLLPIQRQGLEEGMGISKAYSTGDGRMVQVGFAGYNNLETDTYKRGEPNALIARSLVGGTEWHQKYDFVRKAEAKAKDRAESKMRDTIEKKIAQLQK